MLRFSGRPRPLLYFFIEFVLVIAGILVALKIDNWNDEKKKIKLEQTILKELSISLNNDLEDVKGNILVHERGIKSAKSALEQLLNNESIHFDKLINQLFISSDFSFLVSDVSTYEFLKSTGLHIVRNDSLRSKIAYLYNVQYEGIKGIENSNRAFRDNFITNAQKYMSSTTEFFSPNDNFIQIRNDNQILFQLRSLQLVHENILNRYRGRILPAIESLIQDVQNELK